MKNGGLSKIFSLEIHLYLYIESNEQTRLRNASLHINKKLFLKNTY